MPERICVKDCPDPSTVYNNSVIENGTSWAVSSSVRMDCDNGFTLIGHDVLECTENGTWTINVFYCIPDCVDPVTIYANSVMENGTLWAVGYNVTMACMDGFTLLGDNILKCTNDSIWSTDVFHCAADCTDPTPDVIYSEMINPFGLSTFPVDNAYSLTCITGYSVNGNSSMTCYTNSTWSQPQFSCVPGCGDPRKDISHSVILNYTEGTPFEAGIVLVMACNISTTQVGDETVACLSDKTWNKTLKCIPDCSDPRLEVDVENATLPGFKTGSTTAYKSQYKFRCNLKYRMIGNGYIVCHENSTWSQPQFNCEPCKCPCRRVGVPRYTEVTPEVVNQIQEETSFDLAVNDKILSAYIRRKTSVPNKKQVAKSIGYVGAIFLVVILGSIVCLDIPTLWNHLKRLINTIKNIYRYMRHKIA
ncbi:CUB and sushi domain-containing protein 3-like [Mytilus californianus]|uniref:CUB and sushi domain-containing protein 3-like n=1 Tax=Mytilus californianus TaxID=6549 RepID=UPI0022459A7A|nr:CUB and sushi domain-containing protein 3-like [Mytilus californianus]